MTATSRLQLPLIIAGQAQKEIAYNEALTLLDGCVAACVEQRSLATPPTNPVAGACYLVAPGASGAWDGKANHLAIATDGGWRFVVPREGLRAWVASEGIDALFRSGGWEFGALRAVSLSIEGVQVVGARGPAIASPIGGAVVDAEARSALTGLLSTLRHHGLIAP